jgi:membrane protease YdiL (CAAX protease family)
MRKLMFKVKGVGRVMAGFVGMIGVALAWQMPRIGLQRMGAPRLVVALIAGGLAVLLSLVVAEGLSRRLDGRSLLPQVPRRRSAVLRAFSGGVSAVAVLVLVFCLQLGMGWVRIAGYEPSSVGARPAALALLSGLVVYAGVGFSEELFFRGYLLNVLARGRTLRVATLIDGLLFGALHLLGGIPGPVSTFQLLLNALVFTALMTAAREMTGGLWWSMAFHGLWDWAEDDVLGLTTAGRSDFGHALLHVQQHGPSLWVGRAPLVESGLLYLIAGLMLLAVLALFGRSRIGWERREPLFPLRPEAGPLSGRKADSTV